MPQDLCEQAIDLTDVDLSYTMTISNDVFSESSTTSCGGSGIGQIFYVDVPGFHTVSIGMLSNTFDSVHELSYGELCPGSVSVQCRHEPDTLMETWKNGFKNSIRVWFVVDSNAKDNSEKTLTLKRDFTVTGNDTNL